MAKYRGIFSCGHDGVIDIIGPSKDRQRKANYCFSGLCPECEKREKAKAREKENIKNLKEAEELAFPVLQGSPRQVGWAVTIRQNFYRHIYNYINDVRKGHYKGFKYGDKDKTITFDEISHIVDVLIKNNLEANYWINHREIFRYYTIEKIVKLYEEMYVKEQAADIPED